jgi:NAD(P)-dependent dehydrogenase (short-subunit alcohol dehydrogenase family)
MAKALVVGAGGGIGRACVRQLAMAGFDILATDITLERAAPAITGLGHKHRAAAMDVCDAQAVAELLAQGDLDAVVYAAGIVATMPIAQTDFALWRRILAVNLDGAAHVAAAAARGMIACGRGGAMVFVSSAAGVRGESFASAYSASKAGLIGLAEALAAELTSHAIRVNAVAPGNVDTPMLREVAQGIARIRRVDFDKVWSELAHQGAARRLVTPDEVGAVCASLCTPAFSAVTGTTLGVDAGYMLI